MVRSFCAVALAVALAGPAAPAARGAAPARRPARAPAAVAGPAWLRDLGRALPELGLAAGLDECGPRLNDYSAPGLRALRAAVRRAQAAPHGTGADASLVRARLTREALVWGELGMPDRRPGAFLPTEALLEALTSPSVPLATRMDWAAAQMAQSALRLGQGVERPPAAGGDLVRDGILDARTARNTIERIRTYADTLGLEPALRDKVLRAAADARSMVDRFEDHLNYDALPAARPDSRPDTATYARLLAEGYALGGPPAALEARLAAAGAATRQELDSLGARLDPSQKASALVDLLGGTHPQAEDLLPAVAGIFRHAESCARERWPGLPTTSLEVRPMEFGHRVQGMVGTYISPRPLRAAVEEPAFAVALVDPGWPPEVQESFLSQLSVYFDSVLAARHDMPGESMLWRMHRADPAERLWAAGPHTFQAWGMFAQRLAARSGCITSTESRLFQAWTRLAVLARGLADVRLGRRATDPDRAAQAISELTGSELDPARGYVKAILDTPGRPAAVALRMLAFENTFDRLLARGGGEAEALRRLAETALFNPTDQARLLGLEP
ncbi:MAG TPA: DUF885 family protein [Candidatus Saccharimonadales bacterium]|nr:DUF885 family protein [Candidatus Saccharimonadales bacterium]